MKLDTNNHSVFMLHYHLIMCVKYRNKVIDDTVSDRLKEIFLKIAPSYNITLEEWNHDVDHVHILFRGQPNTEISKFINAYKSASSRIIKKEFPKIRKSLWKEMFWSQSFCLLKKAIYFHRSPSFLFMSLGIPRLKSWEEVKTLIFIIFKVNPDYLINPVQVYHNHIPVPGN